MDTDRTTYEKAVRDHLARRRQAVPIVPRDALSPLAERQCRILGADLIQWVNNHADSLKVLWTVDTGGHSVAGTPLVVDGRMLVAFDNGRVAVINPADGKAGRTLELGQPIALGPRTFGKKILVTSVDGTLYRVESLLAAATAGDAGGE